MISYTEVAAQLLQVVVFKDDKLGIRTTKVSPELLETEPCGTADDRWSEEAVRINN